MCCLWTYVVCSWRNWVHWQILSLTLSKWRWPVWCCSCWRRRSIERNPALYWPSGAGAAMVTSSVSSHCHCPFVYVCKSMHQIEPFGGQNWKKSLPWEGGQPPLPPLRRYAPSQSRNLFRNFLFEILGGLGLLNVHILFCLHKTSSFTDL